MLFSMFPTMMLPVKAVQSRLSKIQRFERRAFHIVRYAYLGLSVVITVFDIH